MENILTGLSISLVGIIIVALSLALISFAISLFKYIGKKNEPGKKTIEASENVVNEDVLQDITEEDITEGDILEQDFKEEITIEDDSEIVAAIVAAISYELGKSPENFKILSIKKSLGWKNAAKQDCLQ